ncbi:MAG: hypothetical protein U5O39_15800 [Gammaproteobacteria bacterium]|nr:hypothetical protein [Gammaproteobacteria bacterium]
MRKPTLSIDDDSGESGSNFMEILADARPGALETLQSDEGRLALFEGLAQLSDIEGQVIVAHEFEGVPFKALAVANRYPPETRFCPIRRGDSKSCGITCKARRDNHDFRLFFR